MVNKLEELELTNWTILIMPSTNSFNPPNRHNSCSNFMFHNTALNTYVWLCLVTLPNLLGASRSPPADWLHHDAAYKGPPQHEVKTNYFDHL